VVNPDPETIVKETKTITVVDVFPLPRTRSGPGLRSCGKGIENAEARRIAEEGGLTYAEDRCIKRTHQGLQKSQKCS
jgi:predicted CoA-binding protein